MATKRKKERVRRGGVLYVSKNEFARQMGVSWQAVSYMVKSGKIETSEIDGGTYIDVDKWGPWYKEHLKKSKANGRRRTRKEADGGGYPDISKIKKKGATVSGKGFEFVEPETKIGKEKVPRERVDEIDDIVMKASRSRVAALDYNADDFSDCWIWDEEADDWAYNRTNGTHLLDKDEAIKKSRLLIYRQQFLKEAGLLVPKEDVDYTLRELATPLVNSLSTVPDKFLVRIASYIERLGGVKVDGQKLSNLKEELKDEVTGIIHTLEMSVREALGEEEEEEEGSQ